MALDKCYRLLNHGPTVLVSAQHDGHANVMAAAWACALDFHPPKVTVVIDKAAFTRGLIEQSGRFALQLPTVPQAALTVALGSTPAHQMPDKLQQHAVPLGEGIGERGRVRLHQGEGVVGGGRAGWAGTAGDTGAAVSR